MDSMKRLPSALVLVFSISAAGIYVWKSSQKNPPSPVSQKVAEANKTLPPVMAENTAEPQIIVSDEEVRNAREMMMKSSKSGLIMDEEDVRQMLEKQKQEEMKRNGNHTQRVAPKPEELAPSSKNPGRAVTREELHRALESMEEQAQPE